MSNARKVLRNILAVLSSEILVKILTFAIPLYVARELGKSSMGKLDFALKFAAILTVLGDMGISRLTSRDLARDPGRVPSFVPAAFNVKLILAGGTMVIFAGVSFFIGKSAEVQGYVLLMLVWLFFDSLNIYFKSIFTGLEEMQYVGLMKAFEKLLFFLLFLVVLLVPLGDRKLLGIVLLYPLSAMAAFFMGIALLRRQGIGLLAPPDRVAGKRVLSDGWPFASGLILIGIYLYSDTLFLSYLKGDEITGIYGVSYRLFITLYALQAVLSDVFFPTFSRLFTTDRRHFIVFAGRTMRLLFGLIIPLAAGAIMVAPQAIELIFGPEYLESVLSFRILCLDLIVRVGLIPAGAILLVSGREKSYLAGIAAGAGLNLILNVTLIPAFNQDGAAAATVISEALVLLSMGLCVRSVQKIPWVRAFIIPGLASLGMAPAVLLLAGRSLPLAILAGALSYGLLLIILRGIGADDLEFLKNTLRREGVK
jgi:O-antigen/teichoic acid export membrane protein